MNCSVLQVPDTEVQLCSGDHVKLGRFDSEMWALNYGWYSWGNNRPFCGWYLVSCDNPGKVKPLQRNDLDDIYLIQR